MDAEPIISTDVLARYAGDAAREVGGVSALAASNHQGGREVEVSETAGLVDVRVRIELEWGGSAKAVGQAVQRRVREYVERMTGKKIGAVEVVVERVSAPPA